MLDHQMRNPAGPGHPADLYPAEQIVLGAARLWFHCHRNGEPRMAMLERFFAFADTPWAAASLDTFLRHSVVAGQRRLEVHAVRCPCLSADEERIVHIVAHVQRGWEREAAAGLGQWLAPAAVRLTLPALRGLTKALSAHGYCVPLRPWRVRRPATAGTRWQTRTAPAGVLLH